MSWSDKARDGLADTAEPIPSWQIAAASRVSFYQALSHPSWPRYSHTDDDLAKAVARLGDPLAGRVDSDDDVSVLIQTTQDLPVYCALSNQDMSAMAECLAATWTAVGVTRDDRVLLYDYATSPLVALASRSYLPHLDRGAADILSATAICNDGLPELAARCAHILRYTAPTVLFVDSEVVDPLLDELGSGRPTLRRVVVSGDEVLHSKDRLAMWQKRFGVEVVQLLRSDVALLFAPPCPSKPNTFHPPSAFVLEGVAQDQVGPAPGERVAVTNTAVRSTVIVRYVMPVSGQVVHDDCGCGHRGASLEVA